MDKLLTMSTKELTRLEVMKRLEEKRVKQKEAAEMLGSASDISDDFCELTVRMARED